jgi:two-component system chemotaxis response regulator CheY
MKKILAVDDSPSMRQMVTYTLKRAGFDVYEAIDGVEALELAKELDVDLVLTDINMPKMDGIELIRSLRNLPAYNGKPILTLTTEGSTDSKMKGRDAGATGWIVKPFDPEVLVATINKVLC